MNTIVTHRHGDWIDNWSWSWSSSCGRQSVEQFVWISGLPLGPMTRFYLFLFSFDNYFVVLHWAPSLTRGRVCNLQYNRSLVRSLRTNNHTLPSHLRLYSLFVVSYDSQGLWWRYSNLPPHWEDNHVVGSWVFIWLTPGPYFRVLDQSTISDVFMVFIMTNTHDEAEFRMRSSIEEWLVLQTGGQNEIRAQADLTRETNLAFTSIYERER
jgi:hypothetical protein